MKKLLLSVAIFSGACSSREGLRSPAQADEGSSYKTTLNSINDLRSLVKDEINAAVARELEAEKKMQVEALANQLSASKNSSVVEWTCFRVEFFDDNRVSYGRSVSGFSKKILVENLQESLDDLVSDSSITMKATTRPGPYDPIHNPSFDHEIKKRAEAPQARRIYCHSKTFKLES